MTVAEILLAHDIPLRFEPALYRYVKTGRLTGVELKCRMNTLANYQAARRQLDKEFNLGNELDGLRFSHAFHPDFADDGLDGPTEDHGTAAQPREEA